MGGSGRVPAASGDKRLLAQGAAASSGGEVEKCPRCGSHSTKFCYFNNYNLAQPRHFCKACRRYWTLGGTLRNVPIGGSTRRATQHQSKQQSSVAAAAAASTTRRRSAAAAAAAASPSSSSSSSPPLNSLAFDPPSVAPLSAACKAEASAVEDLGSLDAVRSFESLLTEPLPAGFLALGEPFLGGRDGFGLGLGLGGGPADMEDLGFGLGKSAPAWPFFGDDEGSMVAGNSGTVVNCVGGLDAEREAWQVAGDAGDCFGWPELAMWTTPEKGMH
ncbi:hypothetical protein Taro_008287 [Colocasia esculenta]|uniref:Dof zinc finger protein n=1 Tax=Colocasia esculenta TaxID=4460 RepID=A0A843U2X7_COLES|nr:hypothetical protein [Colocasia esculenta]